MNTEREFAGFQSKTRLGDSEIILAARCGDLSKLKLYFRSLVEKFGNAEDARVLLSNHCNKLGKSVLHESAQNSRLDCVEYLINEIRMDPDCLKQGDWTPLMLACTKRDLEIVKILVTNGADLSLRNKDGWTPFHIACREDNEEIVKFLLLHNPDVWKTKSKNGRTPLHTAALYGRLKISSLLLSHASYPVDEGDNCGSTPLMDSLRNGNVFVAKLLVASHNANCSKVDSLGRQSLHLACQTGQVESVDWLIREMHVNPNVAAEGTLMMPAHFAAKESQLEILKFLQNSGADLTLCDAQQRRPLHLAASGQHSECIRYLLCNALSDDSIDAFGKYAHDYAKKLDAINAFNVDVQK